MMNDWLQADWPAPGNIRALVTLRSGGVSEACYASLNPALHVGDEPGAVLANRRRIGEMLHLPSEPVWLEQVHGCRVVEVQTGMPLQQAEAGFTRQAGVVCAVMTADCLPLLLCNRQGTCIAAVHGGWRGLLAGVIENTVQAMAEKQLLAWLGPAIGPSCFEVGADVRNAFVDKSADFAPAFQAAENGRWLADIYRIARIILARLKIHSVYGGDHCTFSEPQRFYSYRRDGRTGRMAALIWMGPDA